MASTWKMQRNSADLQELTPQDYVLFWLSRIQHLTTCCRSDQTVLGLSREGDAVAPRTLDALLSQTLEIRSSHQPIPFLDGPLQRHQVRFTEYTVLQSFQSCGVVFVDKGRSGDIKRQLHGLPTESRQFTRQSSKGRERLLQDQ